MSQQTSHPPAVTPQQPWPQAVAALVPVYNHASTVGQVIAELRGLGATVWCIDDGSTDDSAATAHTAGANLIHQHSNGGKGKALRRGFAELAAGGWKQVCTVDADGQHPSHEALNLAIASQQQPTAIWVGIRQMPSHAPRASRLGRWLSNLWTRIIAGQQPGDAQCGLRVYPLPATLFPRFTAQRYSFEVEVLIRCAWAGMAIHTLSVSVIYPTDRITHFRQFHDTLRTSLIFARLMVRRLIPWPMQRIAPRQWTWRSLFSSHSSPTSLATAAGLGAAIGVSPIIGIQTLTVAWLCWILRLNFPMALLTSNISLGPLTVLWTALAIAVGRGLRTYTFAPISVFRELIDDLNKAYRSGEYETVIKPLIGDWLIGSTLIMPVVGLITGMIVYYLSRRFQHAATREMITP